jgi:hypothetical protein
MKIVLPIFAIAAGILAAQWLGGAEWVTLSLSESPRESGSSTQASPAVNLAADDRATAILDRAIATLANAASFSSRLRHQVHLFDHDLIGAGFYEQKGRESDRRLRYELKMQLGDKLASQLQVVDERSLWTYRDTATGPLITQVDLSRVEAAEQKAYGASRSRSGIAGLPKLLEGLREHFVFTNVTPGFLGPTAVWSLDGTWRRERLSALFPDQATMLAAGTFEVGKQPQLPDRVVVFISQETMFPLRIEYHRRTGSGDDGTNEEFTPMVTLEFLDARFNEPIKDGEFAYQPGDHPVADVTENYLQARGLAAPK